ncbi:MAG: MOSC domain-containing protein [Deltaproteobacteria bacterium]|nr:MAG: MOSC domain-containing protein [Deltaproteobacteria bacterium]
MTEHRSKQELEQGLDDILASPKEQGYLAMIVRRPQRLEREVLESAELNHEEGMMGDSWKARCLAKHPDKPLDIERQLTLMNVRAVALIAGERERWPLAGDQLYVDIDLSLTNLPPGSQLAIGDTVVEVTEPPHTGCKKFVERFGMEAMQFVNSPRGRELNLRGVNAKVVQPGVVRVDDKVSKHSVAAKK